MKRFALIAVLALGGCGAELATLGAIDGSPASVTLTQKSISTIYVRWDAIGCEGIYGKPFAQGREHRVSFKISCADGRTGDGFVEQTALAAVKVWGELTDGTMLTANPSAQNTKKK